MKKMFRITSSIAVLAMVLAIAGCKNNPDEKAYSDGVKENEKVASTGVIKGKVTFQTGVTDCSGINVFLERLDSSKRSVAVTESADLGRASNTVFYASTVTKSDGSYEFTKLPDGSYTVYAASGDEAAYRSATIVEGSTVTVENLQLVLKGSISGILKVTGGKAAGSIVGVAGTSYIAFVAEDGKFTISGIPAGKHKLCVMTNGKYEAFTTEYTVDGKQTTSAGVISVTIEESSAEGGISYVTAKATDRGIYFEGTIPSNVKNNGSETGAVCSIIIKDNENGIVMHKDWTRYTEGWGSWNMTYPLVNKNKEYSFWINVSWHNWSYYTENVTITATGGLGEYKIENADKYGVELTKDRVIQLTGKQVFTKNDNVKIKRQGIEYEIYKYSADATPSDFWNGTWVYGQVVYGDYNTMPLKDLLYISNWRPFEYADALLSGNKYGVRSTSRIEIAGYSEDDNIYFEMNDAHEAYGEWGGERAKALVVYGWSEENTSHNYKEFFEKDEKGTFDWVVKGLPGTKHGEYPYSEVYNFDDVLYEPQALPEMIEREGGVTYRFRKWDRTFPINLSEMSWNSNNGKVTILSKEIIDGQEYYIHKITADFVPEMTLTVNFMMNDGTDKVYNSVKISSEKQATYNDNWYRYLYDFIDKMENPVREGYLFEDWYADAECTKDYDKTIPEKLYAGWEKAYTATLMDGDKKLGTEIFGYGYDLKTVPEKDGYLFKGWYKDADLKEPADTKTDKNITVYARFVEKETWWTGFSNSASIDSNNSNLTKLKVYDTLYFEIERKNGQDDYAFAWSGEPYRFDFNFNSMRNGDTKVFSYTFDKDDLSFIKYIKNNGLYYETEGSNLYLKAIYYVAGDGVVDYTDYTGSEYSIRVRNDSTQNVVCFKGTPSESTLISGAMAGQITGLNLDKNLFPVSGDFVLYVVTEDDYIAYKDDLRSLAKNPFALIYAFYNADSDANANMVYTISSRMGGEAYLLISNVTNYNVELRQNGLYGEPLVFAAANTVRTKINLPYDEYFIYPVFRKYQKKLGEIVTYFPKLKGYDGDRPLFFAFSLSKNDIQAQEFNVSEWFDPSDFKNSSISGAAYVAIHNGNNSTTISLYKGATSEAEVTSTGGKRINTGKSLVFEVPMVPTSGRTFASSAVISGWRVGSPMKVVDIPNITVEAGKIYYLDVYGQDAYDFTCTWRTSTDGEIYSEIVDFD